MRGWTAHTGTVNALCRTNEASDHPVCTRSTVAGLGSVCECMRACVCVCVCVCVRGVCLRSHPYLCTMACRDSRVPPFPSLGIAPGATNLTCAPHATRINHAATRHLRRLTSDCLGGNLLAEVLRLVPILLSHAYLAVSPYRQSARVCQGQATRTCC